MTQPRILFLTRKWFGHGGMQCLSRDLGHQIRRSYGRRPLFSRPTHIHLGDASLIVPGLILRSLTGARLSVTACGLDVIYPRAWYQRMIRSFLPTSDRVVCISHATAEEARARGVPDDRIVVIPCGIDDERPMHMAPADPGLIVTVGRLIPRKGVAWFIEHVLPLVRQERPGAQYVVIGDGPERTHIESVIRRTGQSASVELKTGCSDAERNYLLSRAAIFVAPNIPVEGDMEGFGIVCIEASSHGIPVIASKLEGLQDAMIEGKTGLFFEPLNAADCAEKIAMVWDRADDCSLVIDRARKNFGWSVLFPLYQRHVFE